MPVIDEVEVVDLVEGEGCDANEGGSDGSVLPSPDAAADRGGPYHQPLAPTVSSSALSTPLERAIVEDMRGIVRGDVSFLPSFFRDLVQYFDEGAPPPGTFSSSDLAHHLVGKASFVLQSLFCIPEVAESDAVHRPSVLLPASSSSSPPPLTPLPRNGGGNNEDEGREGGEGRAPPPSPLSSHLSSLLSSLLLPPSPSLLSSPPRWFDVGLGACLPTSAWRLAVASAFLRSSSPFRLSLLLRLSFLSLLSCLRLPSPFSSSSSSILSDAFLVFLAVLSHREGYTLPSCALSLASAAARSLLF
jgi:hypothetical protein